VDQRVTTILRLQTTLAADISFTLRIQFQRSLDSTSGSFSQRADPFNPISNRLVISVGIDVLLFSATPTFFLFLTYLMKAGNHEDPPKTV